MRLYVVYNGWIGDSAVSVLVIAGSSDEARVAASATLRDAYHGPEKRPPRSYWHPDGLECVELCPDTSQAWVGNVGESDFVGDGG